MKKPKGKIKFNLALSASTIIGASLVALKADARPAPNTNIAEPDPTAITVAKSKLRTMPVLKLSPWQTLPTVFS